MRLLHLADLHLGKCVLEAPMLEDQRYILKEILSLADRHKVDGVLIAGDVYDRSIPPAEAVELLDDFLSGLGERGIPVLAVSGNHDSPERLEFGSRLFAGRGVYIAGRYDGKVRRVTLSDEYGPVRFTLLPFLRPAAVNARLGCAASTTEEAVRAALAASSLPPQERLPQECSLQECPPQERHVLVAHQFVSAGGQGPELCESDTVMVGGSDNVDVSCFDGFDYVALGHLHRAQRMGRDTVRYAGSPLKYSLSEARHVKSVPLVTLGPKGDTAVELLPLTPRRELRQIRGRLDDLLAAAKQNPGPQREDYIYAVLTDEAVLDPAERLRTVYPNLLHVELAPPSREPAGEEAEAVPEAGKSEEELFAEFFLQVTGELLSDGQRAVLRQVIEKAREDA